MPAVSDARRSPVDVKADRTGAERAGRPPALVRDPARAAQSSPQLNERSSGVLLHLTSLPGPHGNGDMGQGFAAVDQLAAAGQRWWQMLPIGPAGYGNSPYSAHSSRYGNPLLLSLDAFAKMGLLREKDIPKATGLPTDHVDYEGAKRLREGVMRQAYAAFQKLPAGHALKAELAAFEKREGRQLDDFALFSALKKHHGDRAWTEWAPKYRDRDAQALGQARTALAEDYGFVKFQQWLFTRQWDALKAYANSRGVGLLGDMPIYVAHDSADVWANRDLFQINAEGTAEAVAGVPPDQFSSTGQRWGNPLYRWDVHKAQDYRWWVDRVRSTLQRFDAVRLDHFIGFQNYYEIPAHLPTAEGGQWRPGPGAELFRVLQRELGKTPFIAEDLGVVTPAVTQLRKQFDLPGMAVLQNAFGTDPQASSFLPENHTADLVAYPSTHDTDTALGNFTTPSEIRSPDQVALEKRRAAEYFGSDGSALNWDLIAAAMKSRANVAVVPVQDLLGLGTEGRMNTPGLADGNWEWRMSEPVPAEAMEKLHTLAQEGGRAADPVIDAGRTP